MQRRRSILIVVTLAETGGAQSYVRDLVPGLVADFDVTVAAHGAGPLGDAIRARGINFVQLEHVRRSISLRDVAGLIELWRLCRRIRPDVIHLNSSKAGVLGRIAGAAARVPVRVFTAHGWAFKASSGLSARLYLVADRLVLRLTTAVVCVSMTERAAGLAAGTCRDSATSVIYNGVDTQQGPTKGGGDRVRVVSVGRLAAPKDFGTLVRAAAQLDASRAELVILGDGPDRAAIESEISRLGVGDRVSCAGEVTDVLARLRTSDVFVLSSASEGLPISILEAMAAGLPIIASSVGGIPELVEDGANGLLVAPADVDQLGKALVSMTTNGELRLQYGSESRRRALASFSIERCRAAHVELYDRLLDAAGR